MKKYIILAAAVIGLIAACTDDNHLGNNPKEAKIGFVLDQSPVTRTVTAQNGETSFVVGDEIGIYATLGASGTNVLHVVTNDSVLDPSKSDGIFYNGYGDKTADFYAYYPWSEQTAGGQVNFTVKANQSNEAAFNASDFMTSTIKDVPVNTDQISLKFQHQMAQIQLKVKLARDVDYPDSVLVHNCKTSIRWKYKDAAYEVYGDTMDIRMWDRLAENDTLSFWALVPPQKIAGGSLILSLYDGDNTYIFKTTKDMEFKANTIKKFIIGIGAEGTIILFNDDLKVEKWEEDDENIVGGGTFLRPKTLFDWQNFDSFNYAEVQKNKDETLNGEGWYRYVQNPKDKVEIVADAAFAEQGKVMHLFRDSTAITPATDGKAAVYSSWHNSTFFFSAADVVKGRYTLEFVGRSSQTANMAGNQIRLGAFMKYTNPDGTQSDYFALIEGAAYNRTCLYQQVNTYDQYKKYSVTFDLRKASLKHAAGNADENAQAHIPDSEMMTPTLGMLKSVVFYITTNPSMIDFYLDDMRLIPCD
ncbi:MAG: fimbrillin family protein [Bacteroides sp.]